MKWFKFYGQDFLTDPKMRALTIEQRMCWIVLLCLANAEDKDGKISHLKEEEIMQQAGIEYDSQPWHETFGFLIYFQELSMITIDNVNGNTNRYNITLSNFNTRQETNLSAYERVKKHREKEKTEAKNDNNDNVINDNARIDKIRIDKNREREQKYPLTYLTNIPEEDLIAFSEKYNATKGEVKKLGEKLKLWSESKNNYKKNNRSFLQGRLLEQYGYRENSGVLNAADYIAQKEAELEAEGNLSFKPDYKSIGRMS